MIEAAAKSDRGLVALILVLLAFLLAVLAPLAFRDQPFAALAAAVIFVAGAVVFISGLRQRQAPREGEAVSMPSGSKLRLVGVGALFLVAILSIGVNFWILGGSWLRWNLSEEVAWEITLERSDLGSLEKFLGRYANGGHAGEAQNRVATIQAAENALRATIPDLQRSRPDYGTMDAVVASEVRKQLPQVSMNLKEQGSVRSVMHLGSNQGADVFRVDFEHERQDWMIALSPSGTIVTLYYLP